MAETKYQNMSYADIRPISQFSNVNPITNVLWGVKNNAYSGNLNPDGTNWKWLCNAIDIYWGKPTLNTAGNVTSVENSQIATTTDLLKFIETTAQAVNKKVDKVEIPKNSGESINLPNGRYVFTWNGGVTEYRDMYWDDESETKMIVFVARQYPLESGNSKLGKIWKAIVCNYDNDSNIISYYDTYTDPDIPDNILALFNEKEVTTTRSGLMSASDKEKLDNIIVDINNYKTGDTILPLGDGYIYYDSRLSYGKYINLERISLAYDDEDGHIERSRGSDNEPFYVFRNNVGQDDESFDVWDSNGRYHGRWDESGYDGPEADYTEAYRDEEHPIDVISFIKEILCENLASENKDGLMSAEDKIALDSLSGVVSGKADSINIADYLPNGAKSGETMPKRAVYHYNGNILHSRNILIDDGDINGTPTDETECTIFCYHSSASSRVTGTYYYAFYSNDLSYCYTWTYDNVPNYVKQAFGEYTDSSDLTKVLIFDNPQNDVYSKEKIVYDRVVQRIGEIKGQIVPVVYWVYSDGFEEIFGIDGGWLSGCAHYGNENNKVVLDLYGTGADGTRAFAKIVITKNGNKYTSSIYVKDLDAIVSSKADSINIADYISAGAKLPSRGSYHYNGDPVHARVMEIDDGEIGGTPTDTTNVIVFCHNHTASDSRGQSYFVFEQYNRKYITTFNHTNVPFDVQKAFNENLATTTTEGLMSTTDKAHLDAMYQYGRTQGWWN